VHAAASTPAVFDVQSPAPRDLWHSLMLADPEALPYQSPAWLDSLCALGKYQDASRAYRFAGGHHYVLPMVRNRHLPARLSVAESMPYAWGRGGVLSSLVPKVEHLRAIFEDLGRLPYLRISVRPNPRHAHLWAAAAPAHVTSVPGLAHILDLDGGFDAVWSTRFKKTTRTRVRKAERGGIVVERDTTGKLVPVFHQLLRTSFDRWADKQHEPRMLAHLRGRKRDPMAKFSSIARHFGEACRIWVAWVDGKPAAAAFVLQYGNVNDARGAIDRHALGSSGANDLIQKLAIEEACHSGCRYYHFGETGASASLAHYKQRFGATPHAHAEYFLEKLPITAVDARVRHAAKWTIGFKDT
jgi:hypothetical protein